MATAFGSTMLTSKATLCCMKGLPRTCPSVCLAVPFSEKPTKLLSTVPVEPQAENLNFQLILEEGHGRLHYFVVSVVSGSFLKTGSVKSQTYTGNWVVA